jgi:hypothetical protein
MGGGLVVAAFVVREAAVPVCRCCPTVQLRLAT